MYKLKNDIYNTGLRLTNKEHMKLEIGVCPFDCHNLRTYDDGPSAGSCECPKCKAGRVVIKLHKLGVLPLYHGCLFATDTLAGRKYIGRRTFSTHFIKE